MQYICILFSECYMHRFLCTLEGWSLARARTHVSYLLPALSSNVRYSVSTIEGHRIDCCRLQALSLVLYAFLFTPLLLSHALWGLFIRHV